MTRSLHLILCCLLLAVPLVEAELMTSKKKGIFGSIAKAAGGMLAAAAAMVVGGLAMGLLKPRLAALPPTTEVGVHATFV
jgi:hypothetical protein